MSLSQKPIKKPKIAIISLTSCEGCQLTLLDLGEKFLNFANNVELVDPEFLKEEKNSGEKIDMVFVEGSPMSKNDEQILLKLREKSKLLIVLGNCAAMGGVPEIANYREEKQTAKHLYKYIHGVKSEPVKEVDNFVKVDFVFPGCPISAEEFIQYFPLLWESIEYGKELPKISDKSVCAECKEKGIRCFLLDGKPCFGSMILGGCGATCPSSGIMCQGCRGLCSGANVENISRGLKNMMTEEEFENTTEIYGLRDDIEAKEKIMPL
ncbi:MAG TPA: hypothetical protein PLB52_00140 [Candidatus Moranbacteria bacterium]|nr:hypothetical protein [Candidatus Moranbacteria bacterium]